MELIAYTAGMEMAKKLIEGKELVDEDFWHWVDDIVPSAASEMEQMEIVFDPDFEIKEDE